MPYYAHSLENASCDNWETMLQHEERVAQRCSRFLARIHPDLAAWGDLLGRWHDLGKYSDAFQAYLCWANPNEACAELDTKSSRVDHSTAGAQHAKAQLPKGIADLFAYVIAGHHAGLADASSGSGQNGSGLHERLKKRVEDFATNAPDQLLRAPQLSMPMDVFSNESAERFGFQLSMLCRMLFSALCDADFLATETFMSPDVARIRHSKQTVGISDLNERLGVHFAEFTGLTSDTNRRREEILQATKKESHHPRGVFSFTVPTGGGKTLSSLAFALNHAQKHDLQRVIYAIPFTSIIEQTADVFRAVFAELGPDVVLEHHSNLDPKRRAELLAWHLKIGTLLWW